MKLPQKNWLEWCVFAASLALIIGVASLLAYDALRGDSSPPMVTVRPGAPEPRGELLEIPVLIENTGGQAVEEVLVEVRVRQVGGTEATAQLTIGLLPQHASAEGRVVVPLTGTVESVEGRVVGYVLP